MTAGKSKIMLVRITPKSEDDMEFLRSLQDNKMGLKMQFWRTADEVDRHVDVWISDKSIDKLREMLNFREIPYEIIIYDAANMDGLKDISWKNIEVFDEYYQ